MWDPLYKSPRSKLDFKQKQRHLMSHDILDASTFVYLWNDQQTTLGHELMAQGKELIIVTLRF